VGFLNAAAKHERKAEPTGPDIDVRPRCWKCDGVVIVWARRPWANRCRLCGAWNYRDPEHKEGE
jgi:ribosomal protein S27E